MYMAKAPPMISDSLIKLPLPTNISYWWNYGSLLGLLLTLQLTSGIMLSMHYCPNTVLAFSSIIHIMQNVNQGWLLHNTHVSGASLFFISMYTHIGRGIYYHSFTMHQTWFMGVLIFMTSMATAFLGYVLPWGQMSFWGATVITNLVTTTPMIGQLIVEWIWGGFAINNATLNRFFSFHFLLPFFMITMVVMHLIFLHSSGSKNPLGINSNLNKVMFHPLFTIKDTLGFTLMLATLMMINLQHPYMFNDPENFTQANPLITPLHIQPEWYFLFAYAILRSIPNKLGGVLALLMAILILYSLQWNKPNMSNKFYPISQIMFWMFSNIFLMLTFMGTQMIEYPYMDLSQILAMLYFSFFPLYSLSANLWDKMMKTLL